MNQCLTVSFLLLLSISGIVRAQNTDKPVSQSRQQNLTPDEVLKSLIDGNQRFTSGKVNQRDITARIAAAAAGQFPKAVILSCLDSRIPVEKVFDVSIGDIFVGRVAGNIVNEDLLGSMEFGTKLSGAKLILILGHSECGAIKGAIDGAELGHITALLAKIQPSVKAIEGFPPDQRTSKNPEFVNQVMKRNVQDMVARTRRESSVLKGLEDSKQLRIVGAVYDVNTGKVHLID